MHIATHLVVLILLPVVLVGTTFSRKPEAQSLQIGPDKIWQGCSSRKYASINEDGLSNLSYDFNMAVITKSSPHDYAASHASSSRSIVHSYLLVVSFKQSYMQHSLAYIGYFITLAIMADESALSKH